MRIPFDDGYIMYPAVDRKPECLAKNEDRGLLGLRILFDDGYNISGCGYKT